MTFATPTITFDLSLNTLIMSAVILIAGWLLKAAAWAVIESIKALVTKLVETIAKVEILDAKMSELTRAVGEHQKLKTDVDQFFKRLRNLEMQFKNGSER